MIDERITKTLSELESSLRNVESARKQVENTVNSYDGLKATTSEYVNKLGNVTTKVKELTESVGKDYAQKVKDYEKDRETVVDATTSAIQQLSDATESFKSSLLKVQSRLIISLIINAVSLAAIISILILFLSK